MGVFVRCFRSRQYRGDADGGLLNFFVGGQAVVDFPVLRDFKEGARTRGFHRGDGREYLFDAPFHPRHVEVAHHGDGFQVGAVPFVVEVAEGLGFEVLDDVKAPDDVAHGVLRAFVKHGHDLALYAELRRAARAPFFGDDSPLGIDFVTVEGQVVRPVVQYQQAGVQQVYVCGGHGADVVHRFVLGGVGVEVAAESDTVFFQGRNNSFAGKVFCTLEGHVLQEMRQTVLCVVLKQGTGVADDVETGTLFGLFVVTEVVGDAVGQLANHDVWGRRQGTLKVGLRKTSRSQ